MTTPSIDLDQIRAAADAGRGIVQRTPVMTSAALSERAGGSVVLKAESVQRTGSFKIRGALSKLAALGPAASAGVTAGSAGNHGQALAFAARARGIPCEIYVPDGTPLSKIAACHTYGAVVVEGNGSLADAIAAARARAAATGMVFCHPFDDPAVIAGQATVGLEIADDVERLGQVVVPVGGGGLASGVAIALKTAHPAVRVVGVRAAACAPGLAGGAAGGGSPVTLADGIAVKEPGTITGPLLERWLDDVVTVDEDAIADAMVLLMERAKLVVEGAGAVGVAALLSGALRASATTTCVVLSGGNVDLGVVPGLIRRQETIAGRRLIVFARITDRPGALAELLATLARSGANLVEVEHVREGVDLHVRETGVRAVFEVRSRDHAAAVLAAARAAGYDVEHVRG